MASFNITNSPENLTLNNARSIMSDYGSLARTARYFVRILPSGTNNVLLRLGYSDMLRQISYLCEAAEMPGRGFMNADLRYYGPNFKVPFQTDYQDITLSFLCRTESMERQLFDDWLETINPTNSFDFEYKDNYKCKIEIFQLAEYSENNSDPKATYKFVLHEAWPILVNPQPVTWADENFLRLSVLFTYRKWTRPERPDFEPRSLSSLIDGADVLTSGGTTISSVVNSPISGSPDPAPEVEEN